MLTRTILVNAVITAIVTALLAISAMSRADEPGSKPAPAPAPKTEPASDDKAKPATPAPAAPPDALAFTMNRIDGTSEDLSIYRGKVVLIVNVASKCGLTPQYAALQKLYESKKDAGFVVLGFPANDFMSQEPGTNKDIKEFCDAKYKVTFPMFEKIVVTGKDAHPLYKLLAALPAPLGGEPKWNFTKFLLDRQGHVVARFGPQTKPDDAAVVKKIDELLAEKK